MLRDNIGKKGNKETFKRLSCSNSLRFEGALGTTPNARFSKISSGLQENFLPALGVGNFLLPKIAEAVVPTAGCDFEDREAGKHDFQPGKTFKTNENVQEVIDMKERIEKIMSCAVTTTSYKLHQMNLLRGDAIVAHDFTYLKEIEEHIEALQNVLNEGKKIHFNRRDKNILIENGIDINLEFREEMKALKRDLTEGAEYAVYGVEPCITRAKTTAIEIAIEIAKLGAGIKKPIDFAKDLQRQLIDNNATKNCGNCPMRYNCSTNLATLPLNERLAIQRIDQTKYASRLSCSYDAKLEAEAKKAKADRKKAIAEATHLEARAELNKILDTDLVEPKDGATYEDYINSIGIKTYPLVKNIIENKVTLPNPVKDMEAYMKAKEMNAFDIELSGKSHKEVATILSEFNERMDEVRTFFSNCTPEPFVDKGVVTTGTKTEPFYIRHLFNMIEDFTKMRGLNHIDETPISKEEYEELGLPCHLNEDGIYVTTQVATDKDEDGVKYEYEFEAPLTRDDYDHIKFYNMVYRTKSVTVSYATMEDISRHQDEVMKAEASGTDTSEYHNLYNKVLDSVDSTWINNLLNSKFFDQSEKRWRKVSLSKIKVAIDDDEDFAPKGSIQRSGPKNQKRERDIRVNDMVRPELGEGAKSTTVSDALAIIRRIQNLRKDFGRFSDKETAMLQNFMGSDYFEFIQLLAFTDIVKKLEAVLVRNIGEHYGVSRTTFDFTVYVSDNIVIE